MIRKLISR